MATSRNLLARSESDADLVEILAEIVRREVAEALERLTADEIIVG